MSHTAEARSMYMVGLKGLRSVIFFAEVFLLSGAFVWAGEVVISKVADPSGSFCHLKFPAIRDDTLFSDRPVLKDPSEGDIIDSMDRATTILSGETRSFANASNMGSASAKSTGATESGKSERSGISSESLSSIL
jgi:hypothetical protein